MKLGILVLVGTMAILVVSGCSRTERENHNRPVATPAAKATATPDEFAFARANFARDCIVCHGDQGDGGLVKVEGVKLKVPSLKTGHALKHSDEDFVDQIEDGGDGMPRFEDKLSPEQINALVRFIRHEFQGK